MSRAAAFIGLLAVTGAALPHHSQVGLFESNAIKEISGIVKSVSWRNPHGQIVLDVTDETGNVTEWRAETLSISIMRNRGFDGSNTISVGDRITIAGAPSSRGRPELLTRSVLLPSGYELTFGSANAFFPAGKSGRIYGDPLVEADAERTVAKAEAEADGLFRVWATIMSDPAAFPIHHEGVPRSDRISIVERFMPNEAYDRLDYSLTTTDAVNFSEPFELTRYFVSRK